MSYDDWKTNPPAAEREPSGEPAAYSESDMRAAVLAERAAIRRRLHEAFFPQRDDKLPGVWMFCAVKDDDGNCQIQDNRLFPRKADVVRAVDAVADFVIGKKP